ncbi:unnamed protein product, partial [Iphiclides podalirius]
MFIIIISLALGTSFSEESTIFHTCIPKTQFLLNGKLCHCDSKGLWLEENCQYVSRRRTCQRGQTFVDFDCNTCYCSKKGKIDPKWCTYDDCDAKREKCNFCICPESGLSKEKACTKNYCTEVDLTRSNVKFTCEPLAYYEFTIGCKQCVCPEMGLKLYAECDASQCNDKDLMPTGADLQRVEFLNETPHARSRRDLNSSCIKYNATEDEQRCTPGTMYIIRCKLCICPYMGNILYFCRPLNNRFYCEQPFPNVYYEPMGRRDISFQEFMVTGQTTPQVGHLSVIVSPGYRQI